MPKPITGISCLVALTCASVLMGCASAPQPEQYGFHRAAKQGQEYICAPPEVALRGSPWLADLSPGAHLSKQDICLTQAEWPRWLILHSKLMSAWRPSIGGFYTTP
jgi:hypothetical protein